MNMKKILASVAAAALTVSAMATAAFADMSFDIGVATQYNATVTFDGLTSASAVDHTTGKLTFTATAPAGVTPDKIKVDLTYIDQKGVKQTASSENNGNSCEFSVNKVAETTDFSKITNVAAGGYVFQANVTLTVHSDKEIKASDGDENYKVTASADGTSIAASADKGKVAVNDNTTTTGSNTFKFDANQLKVVEREELKKCDSAELTVTLGKAPTTDTCVVTLTNKTSKAIQSQYVAKGATTVTFTIPMSEFYNADYDKFETPDYVIDVLNGGDAKFGSGKLVFKTAAPETEATTTTEKPEESDEPDITTTTTAAPETTTEPPASIDTDTTTATTTTAATTQGNAGNTGSTNPPTGVALAIVPAIIAGAAVVASRKRK